MLSQHQVVVTLLFLLQMDLLSKNPRLQLVQQTQKFKHILNLVRLFISTSRGTLTSLQMHAGLNPRQKQELTELPHNLSEGSQVVINNVNSSVNTTGVGNSGSIEHIKLLVSPVLENLLLVLQLIQAHLIMTC